MTVLTTDRRSLLGALAVGLPLGAALPAAAQTAAPGTLRIALLTDIANYDPHQFSFVNASLIKNLYDTLIEYTPEGRAEPSLAEAWTIAPDSRSVTVTLRRGVKFHSGNPLTAEAVATTLKKAADPSLGKNLYPTMSIVQDWTVVDPQTIRLNMKGPVPDRQITDLLQFIAVIDPAGIATVEQTPAGTGAYKLAERAVGQRIRLVANPDYWRQGEPVTKEVVFTIFSQDAAATASLESGGVDVIYGGSSRSAARLKSQGYPVLDGPGPLVQVFRINTTRGPFRNAQFRQAFNYLIDREGILRVGYAGLGQVVALPWAPSSPAYDPSYAQTYAFNIEKGRELLQRSGLSQAEMSDWKLVVNAGSQPDVAISQVVQNTLRRVGINIELDMKEGAELVDSMLKGRFDTIFGGVGNIQKFPSRVATNSIYRTANNPILGEPHPFPEYVAAIERINTTLGSGPEVKAAYDHLNKVLVETSFGIPTNTYNPGLIVTAKNVSGFTLDMDNMLVLRTTAVRR
ncbi:ABC transporter substrate-binding protein [Elioraea rosea]|uniref:ABC transporter substrate-binding protein n=1 Tax=Elioraea rosea TaxID=2492390 RepID=UPI001182C4EF|nr:ABC transporter substrate-binding protein [Elioraea rosea]